MRELIGMALSVLLIGVLIVGTYSQRISWTDMRAAETAGESMVAFAAAAEDYIDANFATLWTATEPVTDPLTGVTSDTVTGLSAATIAGTGLLPAGWVDAQPDGRRHWLAVRRDPAAANSLLALAFTYGTGTATIGGEDGGAELLAAARNARIPLGYMTEWPGDDDAVVGISGAWRLDRDLFAGSGQALTSGHLAAAIYVSEGRVLGPWLCREEYQDRPECNIARTATTFQPDRGPGLNTDAALRIDVPDATDTDATTYQALVVRGVEDAPDWASVPAVTAALYGTAIIDIRAVDPASTTPALEITAPNTAPGLLITGIAEIDARTVSGTALTIDAGTAGTAMTVIGGVSIDADDGLDVLGPGGIDLQGSGDLVVTGTGDLHIDGSGDLIVDEGNATVAAGDLTVRAGDATVSAGNLTVPSGNATVGGRVSAQTFWQTSDPIAKNDLIRADCTPDLRSRLAAIRLHRWNWKTSGRPGLGYNAAEVNSVLPELVAVGPDGLMQVDYPALLALKHECGDW